MSSIQIIVFAPLIAAIIAGLGNRALGNKAAKLITTGGLFLSCALSWPIFISFLSGTQSAHVVPVLDWVRSGALHFAWELRVDALTAVMLVVVTSVSALVHLYSWGYMDEDPDQPRFFAYLSLFTFAMLMLVTANNLVQMFFGWEGVGLASYLLIGFWFKKPSANAAAIKAFVVNRVGDLGFMLGIFGLFMVFGTVSITDILAAAPGKAGSSIGFLGMQVDLMSLLCVLLFIGAMGKSAQLGLHTWLPDAMEGPTPVSALIHAATMVTAGVFMVCRMSPLFETSQFAMNLVTIVGATTAIFAATVGLVQTDIKRVIAYSTCSQLGYMFFAAGMGAYGAAMFHLFTHAFFKALLFLGAGSVIHAMHHEQDMRYYGGLRKHIPLTFWAMMAGTLAITGVGILGVGGFAGFYSKDAIIEVAFAGAAPHNFGYYAFGIGVLAALLTSFYSWRLMFLTFFGKARWIESEHIQHSVHKTAEEAGEDTTGGYHPHESPLPMLIPLAVLSFGAIFAGLIFHNPFVEAGIGNEFWSQSTLYFNEHLMHAIHEVPLWVKLSSTFAMLTGLFIAYMMYIRSEDAPQKLVSHFKPLYNFFYNKWYFDELYNLIFVRPAFWFGRKFWQIGDVGLIDRFGPNGSATAVSMGSKLAAKVQSGYLYTYAFVMLIGLVAMISWVMVQTK
ncbi:NADH-quinone oxidoreductase subunit L [Sphingorhabdus lutea]|uniref:NADH-ubiquinone oxidoreductase chain 5 n=1 Tax=Sphingorhabdus lutea TaxID=1913578 RepID=A0A1L3JBU6_9SPHN|nr:NADH-quinone oxidoreductase subunit L [Sphingorhabdus lutea]APG62598.1 NADH-quinone oxidoreductase subunit L [Sphingorhabdus lutea]